MDAGRAIIGQLADGICATARNDSKRRESFRRDSAGQITNRRQLRPGQAERDACRRAIVDM